MASINSQGEGKFAKKPVIASNKGGYECEFVEKPPKAFQSECPVCLLVLREPFQVTCCGYAFCRVCIERITQDKKPCPCCNSQDFDKFEDKRLKRSLYGFKICCINQKQGCEWVGELGELDNHLNSNPEEQKQLDGCQFTHNKAVAKQIEEKNKQLQEQVAQLTRDLQLHQICTPVCPAEFTMHGFEQHKLYDYTWFSPPFYTHPKGYKMCLAVTANSYNKYDGTHTAVGIHLMKGEFDDQLKWPFRGHITVRLHSQVDNDCLETVFDFNDNAAGNRVLGDKDDKAGKGRYANDFVSHAELQPKYLKNDCLKLRVAKYTRIEH